MPGHHADQRPAWDLYKSTRVQFYHPRCTQAQHQDTTQIKDQLGISTNLPVESTVLPSPVHSGTTPGHHADQRPARDLCKSTSLTVQFHHPRCTQAQRQDTTQIKDQLGISTNLPEYNFTIPGTLRRNARTPHRSKTSLGSLQIYQSTVLPSPVHSGAMPGHHADQRPAWDLYKSTRVQFYHPRCTQAQHQDTTQIKDQLGNSIQPTFPCALQE